MCTVILLRRPGHAWPLLLAANRDEMGDRPWRPPARHWPDRPAIIAGMDVLGGGTWLGVNDAGVTAAVLNRINTLGPAPGRRSRGELPLAALEHPTAEGAAQSMTRIDPCAYRPFNMVIADAKAAYLPALHRRKRAGGGSERQPGGGSRRPLADHRLRPQRLALAAYPTISAEVHRRRLAPTGRGRLERVDVAACLPRLRSGGRSGRRHDGGDIHRLRHRILFSRGAFRARQRSVRLAVRRWPARRDPVPADTPVALR